MSETTISMDRELAERLKDAAYDLGLGYLKGTRFGPGRQTWTTVTVRHAPVTSDSPDGWDTRIVHDGL